MYAPSYATPAVENVWILIDNTDMYEVEPSILLEALSAHTMHNALALIQNMGTIWPPEWPSDITVQHSGNLDVFHKNVAAVLKRKLNRGG